MKGIVRILEELAENGLPPRYQHLAICQYITAYVSPEISKEWEEFAGYKQQEDGSFTNHFNDAAKLWSNFSGSLTFPIPNPAYPSTTDAAYSVFLHSTNKWNGEYGQLRRDFCKHLSSYIQTHLLK